MASRTEAPVRATIRLDKWLWHARFFKTRGLASRALSEGGFRINRNPVSKSSVLVGVGDVLTFVQGGRVRVVQVLALGLRRGPATEAQGLYLDLTVSDTATVPPTASLRE